MKKQLALNIINEMTKDTLADYIVELHDCIRSHDVKHDIEFLMKEFECSRWYKEAEDEVGESGTNFMYFVAGFKCCYAIK